MNEFYTRLKENVPKTIPKNKKTLQSNKNNYLLHIDNKYTNK